MYIPHGLTVPKQKLLITLANMAGTPAEILRAIAIRDIALALGEKLMLQLEESKPNAMKLGRICDYWNVHEALTVHLGRLKNELHARWWLDNFSEYANDHAWKLTLRGLVSAV